ncbi:MAG: hypothetical protein N2450_09485 [bacterium]|nr:hypothetical protein [bacterium]
MISTPVVIAPLTSALLGLPWLGFLTGILFQLLWITPNQDKKVFRPDSGFAALLASALSASLVGPLAIGERLFSLWPFSIVFGFLVSPFFGIGPWIAAQFIHRKLDSITTMLSHQQFKTVATIPIKSLILSGFIGAVMISFFYVSGYYLWAQFQMVWYEADPILLTIVPLFAGVGLANVTKIFVSRDTILAFILGAGIMMIFELVQRM